MKKGDEFPLTAYGADPRITLFFRVRLFFIFNKHNNMYMCTRSIRFNVMHVHHMHNTTNRVQRNTRIE